MAAGSLLRGTASGGCRKNYHLCSFACGYG